MSNGIQGATDSGKWERRIGRDTDRLRYGSDPALQRMRDLVASEGIDVDRSLVANLMQEDMRLISGIIVEPGGRVHEFEYDWRGTELDQGRLAVWRDITDTYQSHAFREPIAAAIALAQQPEHAPTA